MDIIHRPVFRLKHDVTETGVCLRLQVEPIHLGPVEIVSFSGHQQQHQ
jgi:hypothetical protein